jgi:hypothetical protein
MRKSTDQLTQYPPVTNLPAGCFIDMCMRALTAGCVSRDDDDKRATGVIPSFKGTQHESGPSVHALKKCVHALDQR